ncbi:MAG: guanylate kinase [Candidatus Omnitrophota bacterium]
MGKIKQSELRGKKGILIIISGPSGSGKTTLAGKIIKEKGLKSRLKKSISFTTRHMRSGESKGKDYFFISEEEFRKLRRAKKILEWTKYIGYYYGTPKEFVDRELERGHNIVLCVDLKGVLKLRQFFSGNSISIFIMPPSIEVLKYRIENRCKRIKKEEVLRRIDLAKKEMLQVDKFDFCLKNEDLQDSIKQLREFILKKIDVKKR